MGRRLFPQEQLAHAIDHGAYVPKGHLRVDNSRIIQSHGPKTLRDHAYIIQGYVEYVYVYQRVLSVGYTPANQSSIAGLMACSILPVQGKGLLLLLLPPLFLASDIYTENHPAFQEVSPNPSLATTKGFLRYLAHTSKGRLAERMTVDSLTANTDWFFAASKARCGTV